MNSSTINQILFLGNRAANIFKSSDDDHFKANYITYTPANPFSELNNLIVYNKQEFETACEYELECLKDHFVSLIHSNKLPSSFKLIVGDPSELIYQAFCIALMEAQLYIQQDFQEIHLWLYPMGMTSLDIRKELSQFIFELKKNEIPVLLLRKPINESDEILKSFYLIFETSEIYELIEKMDGVEFLICKKKVNLIDG